MASVGAVFDTALALIVPISSLIAEVETVHQARPGDEVTNDDHGQMMCRFENGTMGSMCFSRIATVRKMGYAYEVTGTKGTIRFDQEDQNAIWLYQMDTNEAQRGFTKILKGTAHPDYLPFCKGPAMAPDIRTDHHRSKRFS